MTKITDTIRILAGLRGGCTFAHVSTANFGRGNAFFEHDYLRHPDGRERAITWPSLKAAVDGLIDRGPEIDFHRGQSSAQLWVLTPAGQSVAAALPSVDLDKLFVGRPR